MIETIVLRHLQARTHLPCYPEVPELPESEYIVIEKTGSGRSDCIDRATIAVKSCSHISLLRAAEINESVKEAMDALPENPEIFRSALNGDYNYTDTETKTYRYQAVYDITFQEVLNE